MANLLSLPPELLSHILSFLPDLLPTSNPTIVGPSTPLTPSICRASRALRREALPLYASSRSFVIQTDEPCSHHEDRVHAWLDALGDEGVRFVRSLQLSMHWRLARPSRWMGHVGFYVRVQLLGGGGRGAGEWKCERGTYPIVNDVRGMRLESVNLLQQVVGGRLLQAKDGVKGRRGLTRADVEFVVRAMEIVARHPIEAFDLEQSQEGRRGRRTVFEGMERELRGLGEGESEVGEAGCVVESSSTFFTPY